MTDTIDALDTLLREDIVWPENCGTPSQRLTTRASPSTSAACSLQQRDELIPLKFAVTENAA